ALARMHQIESLVDVGKRHRVGDHRIDLDLAIHVPVDDPRHVGAASRAAEGGALPHPSSDELEWPRRDLGTGWRDADNDADTPAAMADFQRLAHHRDIASAVERIVRATDLVGAFLRYVDKVRY